MPEFCMTFDCATNRVLSTQFRTKTYGDVLSPFHFPFYGKMKATRFTGGSLLNTGLRMNKL